MIFLRVDNICFLFNLCWFNVFYQSNLPTISYLCSYNSKFRLIINIGTHSKYKMLFTFNKALALQLVIFIVWITIILFWQFKASNRLGFSEWWGRDYAFGIREGWITMQLISFSFSNCCCCTINLQGNIMPILPYSHLNWRLRGPVL